MQNCKNGFTLIELALSLIIIGVLLGSILLTYQNFQSSIEIGEDDKRLDSLNLALQNYYHDYKKLPCPAVPNLLPSDTGYGIASPECTTSCPAGLICNSIIATGVIPYKTLNVPFLIAQDSFGMSIGYTVDRKFTTGRCTGRGGIKIINKNSNVITDQAIYTVVNNGKNLSGSYSTTGGSVRQSCNTLLGDGENCNDNGIFSLQNIVYGSGINYYDDLLKYFIDNEISSACPLGLSDCSLWLTAANNNCELMLASSSTTIVNEWIDKSPNNYIATQSSQTLMPSLVNNSASTVNGYTYLSFNSNLLNIVNALIIPNTNFTLSVVFQTTASDGAIVNVANGSSFSATADRILGIKTINGTPGTVTFSIAGSPLISTAKSYNDGNIHIVTVTVDSVFGTTIYVDGYPQASNASATASTFSNQTNFNIGGTIDQGWQAYLGNLMEVVMIIRTISDIERISFEKEMASKWSIAY